MRLEACDSAVAFWRSLGENRPAGWPPVEALVAGPALHSMSMPERERLWFPWRLIHRLEIRMEHVEPLCTSPVIDALTTDCDHVRATASRIAADLRWQDISDEALVGWVGAWAWVHVESRRALPARGILGITGRELEGLYLRLLCSVGIWLAARKGDRVARLGPGSLLVGSLRAGHRRAVRHRALPDCQSP
jgi:hypothetical protein